ncbi:MAG: cupredoxin domain-containing protein [Gemmatimonadota bacterium]|nr:cupredoxin domain-containing protein [Gemmatimonadota bacterium]
MTGVDWMVLLGAIAAIAWVNMYFFAAGRRANVVIARPDAGDGAAPGAIGAAGSSVPNVIIRVEGGYDPRVIRTKAGRPVRLVFDRQETSSCSEEVVFPDFGIRQFLPAFAKTTVEVTPPVPGRYLFTCGMSMLRGEIVAEP